MRGLESCIRLVYVMPSMDNADNGTLKIDSKSRALKCELSLLTLSDIILFVILDGKRNSFLIPFLYDWIDWNVRIRDKKYNGSPARGFDIYKTTIMVIFLKTRQSVYCS